VLYLDWFAGITEHSILHLAIGQREAVMLSLVFGPGVNLKALQIDIRSFRIEKNSPARGAVTAANSLIFVDLMQELRRFLRIDEYFTVTRTGPSSGSGSSSIVGLTQ
jgi:hypothetical protein